MSEEIEKSAAQIAREKRQARIKAKAAERMAKITGTVRPDGFEETKGVTDDAPASAPQGKENLETSVAGDHEDPPDVDISLDNHSHQLPSARNRNDPFGSLAMQFPPDPDDPLTAMLQQMLGQAGHAGEQGGESASESPNGQPDLSKLMSMMMGEGGEGFGGAFGGEGFGGGGGVNGMNTKTATPPTATKSNDTIWTVLHTLNAVLIGVYVAVVYGHKWTALEGYFDMLHSVKPMILFVSVQLVLQTARLVQDKGRLPPDSMLLQLASFVPQPYRGYIESGSRLYKTFALAKNDFFVAMFVYGLSMLF